MERPLIQQFDHPSEYVQAMIRFRKNTEPQFTVQKATRGLRRVSPTLVSLVVRRKRQLTLDRVDEFSKLLSLNAAEKSYLRHWLEVPEAPGADQSKRQFMPKDRKEVSTNILSDWINVYVKDFFQIPAIQKNPDRVAHQLLPIASAQRVGKAINFLIREGYLRKTLSGETVIDTRLSVADPKVPSRKIRQFHKGALALARAALDLYPMEERLANTLIIPLDEEGQSELRELIGDFAERLKEFAARQPDTGRRLYQLIINLSPVGGKLE